MHLKSLTVKGFKSFASATTLRLEPGITCVVGPNGSGKSNVVDAIAWVLGEQGAKALRGGKMEDVIFAGTAGRAPLGRAEVTLTIDNGDGALPIDYTEVSITRRMFRSGESEYEINGNSCRLLDIQELLSDSGIGREMHIIVGQGRLDAMLHAKPEDRRAFIEEAAGVLKHRKRKEKAIRKLDAMQTNLNRLNDLTAELRRQLKPLGKQAEVARRAAGIQADLRDARLRLLADDLHTLRTTLDREIADESAMRERRAAGRGRRTARSSAGSPTWRPRTPRTRRCSQAAQDTWYKLSALQERFRSTEQLASERLRHLAAAAGRRAARAATRTSWRPRPSGSASRRRSCARRSPTTRCGWPRRSSTARSWNAQLAAAEGALRTAAKAIADRREGLAKLTGNVNAARARTGSAAEEIERLAAAHTDAHDARRGRAGRGRRGLRRVHRGRPGQRRAGRPARRGGRRARPGRRGGPGAVRRRARRREGRGELEGPRGGARARAAPQGRRRRAARPRPTRCPACSAASPRCSPSGPGTRPRWPPRWARSPTRSPSPASTRPSRRCVRSRSPTPAGPRSWSAARRRPACAGPLDALRPALPEGAVWAPDVIDCPDTIRPALNRALRDVVLVADLAAAARLVAQQRRAARGHAGRRRARRVRGGRRLRQGHQLHRGAGRGRRGRAPSGQRPSSRSASSRPSSPRPAPRWPSTRRR